MRKNAHLIIWVLITSVLGFIPSTLIDRQYHALWALITAPLLFIYEAKKVRLDLKDFDNPKRYHRLGWCLLLSVVYATGLVVRMGLFSGGVHQIIVWAFLLVTFLTLL